MKGDLSSVSFLSGSLVFYKSRQSTLNDVLSQIIVDYDSSVKDKKDVSWWDKN